MGLVAILLMTSCILYAFILVHQPLRSAEMTTSLQHSSMASPNISSNSRKMISSGACYQDAVQTREIPSSFTRIPTATTCIPALMCSGAAVSMCLRISMFGIYERVYLIQTIPLVSDCYCCFAYVYLCPISIGQEYSQRKLDQFLSSGAATTLKRPERISKFVICTGTLFNSYALC